MSDMAAQKPATAARMYDYYLGGIHNFPADQDAARRLIALFPHIPVGARANRAFLRRAVRHLATIGVRQFLDIGSGIPTEGNVHEVVQAVVPDGDEAHALVARMVGALAPGSYLVISHASAESFPPPPDLDPDTRDIY